MHGTSQSVSTFAPPRRQRQKGQNMSSSEPNATPDQLSIDDQLIALVRVARALRYDEGAEWISRRAMVQADKAIAEVSEPRKCVQTVNRFGFKLSQPCELIEAVAFGGDK